MLTERRRQPKKQAEKNRQQSDANFSNEFPGHGAKRILARRRCANVIVTAASGVEFLQQKNNGYR